MNIFLLAKIYYYHALYSLSTLSCFSLSISRVSHFSMTPGSFNKEWHLETSICALDMLITTWNEFDFY